MSLIKVYIYIWFLWLGPTLTIFLTNLKNLIINTLNDNFYSFSFSFKLLTDEVNNYYVLYYILLVLKVLNLMIVSVFTFY